MRHFSPLWLLSWVFTSSFLLMSKKSLFSHHHHHPRPLHVSPHAQALSLHFPALSLLQLHAVTLPALSLLPWRALPSLAHLWLDDVRLDLEQLPALVDAAGLRRLTLKHCRALEPSSLPVLGFEGQAGDEEDDEFDVPVSVCVGTGSERRREKGGGGRKGPGQDLPLSLSCPLAPHCGPGLCLEGLDALAIGAWLASSTSAIRARAPCPECAAHP